MKSLFYLQKTKQKVMKNHGSSSSDDEEEEGYAVGEEEVSDDDAYTDEPWVEWYCSLKGNEFFALVPEEFLLDNFELYGIAQMIRGGREQYEKAMQRLLDEEEQAYSPEEEEAVEQAAETVYGIAHSRYILTMDGLKQMKEKYERKEFGTCPRALCGGQPVLPLGETSIPQSHRVKVYCCKCNDIYYPKNSVHKLHLDGAYWGPSFPHLFYGQFNYMIPQPSTKIYTARIYGFRIHNPQIKEQEKVKLTHLLEDNPYSAYVTSAGEPKEESSVTEEESQTDNEELEEDNNNNNNQSSTTNSNNAQATATTKEPKRA